VSEVNAKCVYLPVSDLQMAQSFGSVAEERVALNPGEHLFENNLITFNDTDD
jgi:hypothetical protein